MKKILIYDARAKESFGGGSSKSLYLILKNRKNVDNEYYFITNRINRNYYKKEMENLNIKEFYLDFPPELLEYGGKYKEGLIRQGLLFLFVLLPFNIKVSKELKKEKFDILICNEGRAALTLGVTAKIIGLKMITFIRGDYGINSRLNNLTSKMSTRLICVSEGVYGLLDDWKKNKSEIIHNGIEIVEFEDGVKKNDNIIRICNIANISPYKGSINLLKAAKILVNKHKNIKFYFIGDIHDQEYYNGLKDFISVNGLRDYIEFTGKVDNVHEYLEYMDIYVQPSYNEGLPRVILEAYLHKLPVVASDIPGNKSIVIDKINGLIYKKEDYKSLAEKIDYLINKPKIREKYGYKGKMMLVENHSIDLTVKKFEELIQEI